MCTGADQNNGGTGLEKIAKRQKRLLNAVERRVVQTKAHFFRFLKVNIRLRIEQDNICFFQVLMQLYSTLLPSSAPYNFLHSRCLYKVPPFLDMLMSIEIDKSRYKSIASPENFVIIDFYQQIKLINRQLLTIIEHYRLID